MTPLVTIRMGRVAILSVSIQSLRSLRTYRKYISR